MGKTPGGKQKRVEGSYANEGLSWHSERAQELDCIYLCKQGTMDCKHREQRKTKVIRCSPQLALRMCTRTEVAIMKLLRYK